MLIGIIKNKSAITKTSFAVLAVAVLVFSMVMIASTIVSGATVTTDKADYAPDETVLISGNGFTPNTLLTQLQIIRPDGVDNCPVDGRCSALPTTDSSGSFSYDYALNIGVDGLYTINVLDALGVFATGSFSDSRTISWVKLDGASSVIVAPSASIPAEVRVAVTSPSTWESTKYQIGSGSTVCVNHIDHNLGTFTESFSITAPASAGTYNFKVWVYRTDDCTIDIAGGESLTLTNGITVQAQPVDVTIVAKKVVCNSETDLPNWQGQSIEMTSTTASDYVAAHPNCHIENGWNFQWAFDASNPGDNIEHAGTPWNTFGPTSGGMTSVVINNANTGKIKLREELKPGYFPFSGIDGNSVTAEFYCDGDVMYYDNYDFIDDPILNGHTYYCVGFNALTAVCGNGIIEGNEVCEKVGGEWPACCNTDCTFKPAQTSCRASERTCDIAETCTGSSATCPANGYQPSGTACDDNSYCNGHETCNGAGVCSSGTDVSCSAYNLLGINTCDNNPDNIHATLDFRTAFTSSCNEATDSCTTGSETITHTCDVTTCDAACDSQHSCQPQLTNNVCYYNGQCGGTCACTYSNSANCPVPGTVIEGTCYYGTQSCTENGCGLLTAPMGCNNVCDPVTGPKDTQGPITSLLTAIKPSEICTLNIEATVTDTCSNIAAAEYFIGGASCEGRTDGTLMDVKDGNWNNLVEEVIKNNVGAYDGSFNIFVRGRDAAGNWGACTAIQKDVDCLPPSCPTNMNINGGTDEVLVCGNNPILNANVCDDETAIQMAEYFIDTTNPLNWLGINMTSSDGAYDEKCEDVTHTVNIGQLTDGTHLIKLHAKDKQENWGKFAYCPTVTFVKDTTAPETEKVLTPAGGISVPCSETTADGHTLTNGCAYVKQGSTITLTASDPDPQKTDEHAGNVVIHYNVYWRLTEQDAWTLDQTGQSTVNQPVIITLNKDSYHLVEYWSTDGCEWSEEKHYELDIVDTQAPIFTKTVGEPKVPATGGYDYYVTQNTEICLSAIDQQPHPVGGVSISCDVKVDEGQPTPIELDERGCFNYGEDTYHELTCTATDALGNPATLVEKDIVDTLAPVTTELITGPKYVAEQKTYLDAATRISLSCQDQQPHPVGGEQIFYKYSVDGQLVQDWKLYTGEFGFPEESQHTLQYYCKDALGNQETTHTELYYVDHTTPITIESYGTTPYVIKEGVEWITSQTPITLSATDPDTTQMGCNSGVAQTKYRVTLLGSDAACLSDSVCQGATGSGEWDTYGEQSFTIGQTSCHLVEYYSVDNVDKTEVTKKQCVFVDNEAPTSSKLVGNPKYPCVGGTDKCGTSGTFPPVYVTTDTPISITCTDVQPHPVDNSKFCFKVSQTQLGDLTGAYCENYDGQMNEGSCCINTADNQFTFNFLEESLHKIEWTCTDALGNRGALQTEWDNVDDTSPAITIWNPTLEEAGNVERCSQAIVIQAFDSKSGVNESSIYAELYYPNGTAVPGHKVMLKKSIYGTFEGLMDKQLPAGEYVLKIFASDNVGNLEMVERDETLTETVFVEYVSPSSCNIDPETEGNCDFTFHVCMRGENNLQFWMDKLGNVITPDMMSATISKGSSSAFVGLKHGDSSILEVACVGPYLQWDDEEEMCYHLSDAELLPLATGCTEINGRETFNLHLNLDTDVTSQIGLGVHDLEYWIESSSPQCQQG